MAVVSIPMVANDKPLADMWKSLDETHFHSKMLLQAAHEKMLFYGSVTVLPPKTSPDLAREKALAYVSEARAAVGAKRLTKLPRGRISQGNECVLARALPYCSFVSGGVALFHDATVAAKVAQAWATTAYGSEVTTPEALRDFVCHFDNRQYEDLIA